MCCEQKQNHSHKESTNRSVRHRDCSCRAVGWPMGGILLFILFSICVPCARGEYAQLRLDRSIHRGATDLINHAEYNLINAGGSEFFHETSESLTTTHDHDHDHDHEHEHSHDKSSMIGHIIGGGVVSVVVAYIGAMLPVLLTRMNPAWVTACNAFGAGGFWGLAFTHLFMEALDLCLHADLGINFASGNFFNGAYPLALLGYVFLLWVETILNWVGPDETLDPHQALHEHHRDLESDCSQAVKTPTGITPGSLSAGVALTLHSFLEGLIIGLRDSPSILWMAVISVSLHRWAVALTIATRFWGQVSTRTFWIVISIFAWSGGAAVIIGHFIGTQSGKTTAALNGFCVGVVFYAAQEIMHIVFHQGTGKSRRAEFMQLLALTLGAGLVFGATCLHLADDLHSHH